jgi:hypothetical protein
VHNEIKTIQDWLEKCLLHSSNDWYFTTFKVSGTYKDNLGMRRQIFNDISEPRILRALDWTITNYRRRFKYQFRFVPFIGGSKELGINKHIHAFIELSPNCDAEYFLKDINKRWFTYVSKSLKRVCVTDVWLEKYQPSKGKPIRYCVRQEDSVRLGKVVGDEKVLLSCSSFLL